MIMSTIIITLTLTTLIVLANINPDILYDLQAAEFWAELSERTRIYEDEDEDKLFHYSTVKDIAIVKDILRLNIIYTVVMVSGIIFWVLRYVQVVKPTRKTKKMKKETINQNIEMTEMA